MHYRRTDAAGGTDFFTVNLAERRSDRLVHHIDNLRAAIKTVKEKHPFSILAMIVLPEHLHALWRLPPGDADYPLRWSMIKSGFSRQLVKGERISASRQAKRERGIWQRRYWEHQIRDDINLARHVDYTCASCNCSCVALPSAIRGGRLRPRHSCIYAQRPVKHGWVTRAVDWPHSTLHSYIERGIVTADWGGHMSERLDGYGER